ncbi:MAG: hypothetical protein AAGA18_03180 [Verrucomicrobiota bacterium]
MPANTLSYTDHTAAPRITYYYQIIAVNEASESLPNNEVNTTTWTKLEPWRFNNFGTIEIVEGAAKSADIDLDKLINLEEYALRTDPNVTPLSPYLTSLYQESSH